MEIQKDNIIFQTEAKVKGVPELEKLIKALSKMDSSLPVVQGLLEGVNDVLDENADAIKEAAKQTDNLEKSNKKAKKSQEELNKEFEDAKKQFKDQIRNINILGTSLGQVSDLFKQGSIVVRTYVRRLGTIKGSGAVGALGAIGAAVASVGTFFTKAQSGIDIFNQGLAGVSGAAGVIFDRLGTIGSSIVGAAKGTNEWADVWQTVKNSSEGVVDDIKAAANEGIRIEKLFQQIAKDELEVRRRTADIRAEIKALNLIGEDTTKTFDERSNAIRRAASLERGLLTERQGIAERQLSAQQQQNELDRINGEVSIENIQKEIELVENLSAIQQESLELQTTLNNKLNTIEAERERRLAAIAAAQKQIREQTEDLVNSLIVADYVREIERIRLDGQRAIEAVESQKVTLIEQLIGTPDEIASQTAAIEAETTKQIGLISQSVVRQQQELEGAIEKLALPEVDPLFLFRSVAEGSSENTRTALDNIDEFLTNAIAKFEEFANDPAIQGALNAFNETSELIFQTELARTDALINTQRDRVNSALRIAGEGNAEILQLEEERLNRLEQRRQRFAESQRRLEAFQIAGAQAVAVAKSIQAVASAFATGNIVGGIATSLALAATVAGAIVSTKAAFSNVPSFDVGTENVFGGNVDNKGGQLAVVHKGERILTKDQNAPLLKMGIHNSDVPELIMDGLKYRSGTVNIDAISGKPGSSIGDSKYIKRLVKAQEGTNSRLDALEIMFNVDEKGFSAGMRKRAKRQGKRDKL